MILNITSASNKSLRPKNTSEANVNNPEKPVKEEQTTLKSLKSVKSDTGL